MGLFLCVGIKIQEFVSEFFVCIFCSATFLVQISYLLLQTHIITSFWFIFFYDVEWIHGMKLLGWICCMKLQAHMKQAHGLDFFYEVVSTHNTNES
jgi:hypothetical protein